MNESDYIKATNLAKLCIAESAIREIMPELSNINQDDWVRLVRLMDKIICQARKAVKVEEDV